MARSKVRAESVQSKGKATRTFVMMFDEIWRNPRVGPMDQCVLTVLISYARRKSYCWPSDTTIAREVGRSRATVQRRLRHLEEIGLLRRERVEPDATNRTGRRLHLTWVVPKAVPKQARPAAPAPCLTSETPPVSPVSDPPVSPVSDKRCAVEREKENAAGAVGLAAQGPPPTPPGRRPEPTRRGLAEVREHYTACEWLTRPPGDPLRLIAEARLADAAAFERGDPPAPEAPWRPRHNGRPPERPRPHARP